MITEKECVLTFNKTGYDPFIDYLKGICILNQLCEKRLNNSI